MGCQSGASPTEVDKSWDSVRALGDVAARFPGASKREAPAGRRIAALAGEAWRSQPSGDDALAGAPIVAPLAEDPGRRLRSVGLRGAGRSRCRGVHRDGLRRASRRRRGRARADVAAAPRSTPAAHACTRMPRERARGGAPALQGEFAGFGIAQMIIASAIATSSPKGACPSVHGRSALRLRRFTRIIVPESSTSLFERLLRLRVLLRRRRRAGPPGRRRALDAPASDAFEARPRASASASSAKRTPSGGRGRGARELVRRGPRALAVDAPWSTSVSVLSDRPASEPSAQKSRGRSSRGRGAARSCGRAARVLLLPRRPAASRRRRWRGVRDACGASGRGEHY